MNTSIERAIGKLISLGWQCTSGEDQELPVEIRTRYPWLPHLVTDAVTGIQEAVHPGNTIWLLTAADYNHRSESQFAWNEWEIISLEAAGTDTEWAEEIRSFWDAHFPLALSVGDAYEYYALTQDGKVVCGEGPDFQSTSPFADSYLDFLSKISELE